MNTLPARLGFGTAGMSLTASPGEARRLLDVAWDCGIRYFDTAPLYAYGEAEKRLGQFLRGRQDQAVVCTKVGLYPARLPPCFLALGHRGLALLKYSRQTLAPLVHRLRRSTQPADPSRHFDVQRARQSFDNSLRALGSDHVDSLLLHEVDIATANRPDVLAFLHQERQRGRLTDHGIGSDADRLGGSATQLDPAHQIVQIANSVLHPLPASFSAWRGRVVNTHGAVRFASKLFQWLRHHPTEQRRWENDLGRPLRSVDDIGTFMLAWAVDHNPGGTVVFFSSRPHRIQACVRTMQAETFSRACLSQFESLARSRARDVLAMP